MDIWENFSVKFLLIILWHMQYEVLTGKARVETHLLDK